MLDSTPCKTLAWDFFLPKKKVRVGILFGAGTTVSSAYESKGKKSSYGVGSAFKKTDASSVK